MTGPYSCCCGGAAVDVVVVVDDEIVVIACCWFFDDNNIDVEVVVTALVGAALTPTTALVDAIDACRLYCF